MLDASSDSGLLPSIPKLLIKDSAPLQNTQPRGGPPPRARALCPAPSLSASCCPLPSAALLSLLQGTISGLGFN